MAEDERLTTGQRFARLVADKGLGYQQLQDLCRWSRLHFEQIAADQRAFGTMPAGVQTRLCAALSMNSAELFAALGLFDDAKAAASSAHDDAGEPERKKAPRKRAASRVNGTGPSETL